MNAEERWLPVVGLEAWYEVSDLGRVRRVRAASGEMISRLLKPSVNSDGYLTVGVGETRYTRRTRPVHLLVADAFMGPRGDGLEVDHVDGDKKNPRRTNLEAVSHGENIRRGMARKRLLDCLSPLNPLALATAIVSAAEVSP